jgi:uncharacterized membrane protein HdeD (DUF308 family)
VQSEDKCPSCGGVSLDRRGASARLSDYFRRETGASSEDADRRAGDVMSLLGRGAGLLTLAPVAALSENWWLFTLRGILAILFGVLTLVQPVAALTAVVLVFGAWAFIDGISALALGISGWRSWQLVLAGLVGIAVGVYTFYRPEITATVLYAAVAAWSIARGILEIVVAIELRKQIKGELWLVLAGLTSILFGALMIVLPVAGVLALAWLIGVYALAFGSIMLVLSVRLRRLKKHVVPEKRPLGVPTTQPA